MRWERLQGDSEKDPSTAVEAAPAVPPLPLALPTAVARTFDTPGFAGMTFYEVRAKSVLNRVPSSSRVPFEWTVNPYRGCTHACVYCLVGDTPILLADGRTRPIAELRVGDAVYGTVRQGRHLRYTETEVLAHWQTSKPAYRLTLQDGTRLIASGDHRFLSDRGWRYVAGREAGPDERPGLTTAHRLVGTGMFTAPPKDSVDYRRGYVAGLVRGGGALASAATPAGTFRRFRLDLSDWAVLARCRDYLGGFGIAVHEATLPSLVSAVGAVTTVHTTTPTAVEDLADLVRWPGRPDPEWYKGYLAGLYDVAGRFSRGVISFGHPEPEVLDRASLALRDLRIHHTIGQVRRPRPGAVLRLDPALRDQLRFLHTVDPAATDRWTMAGAAVPAEDAIQVVNVEPLGLELPMFDITTGTGDFVANGVVSHNCFARNTHTYLDLDAGQDFDSKVVVKVNAPEVLRRELAAPKWGRHPIAMGTNVDCYQRAEGKYQLMRGILAALRDFANPFSILTKGTLITRDLDLLRQAAEVTEVRLAYSVGFVDELLWRKVEPGTPSPRRRLAAISQLTDAGFDVTVLLAPVLPGLTDTDESIDATVAEIAGAGAVGVVPLTLHLRPGAREWYAAWLGRNYPRLVPRYRELYRRGSYAPDAYQREVSARVAQAARRHGLHRREMARYREEPPVPNVTRAEQLTLL